MQDNESSIAASPSILSVSARLGNLQFHRSGKFRILQFADVQDVPNIASDTISYMQAVVEQVRPDIVVFSGNQIAGYEKPFAPTFRRRRWEQPAQEHDLIMQQLSETHADTLIARTRQQVRNHIRRMVDPLEQRGIPWVVTYGNHDFQCGLDPAELDDLYREFPGCLNPDDTVKHNESCAHNAQSIMPHQTVISCEPGTFALPVRDMQSNNIVFALILINSGDYAPNGGYATPSPRALRLLRTLPQILTDHACVFQHLPIAQYYDILKEVPAEMAAAAHAVEGYRKFSGRYFMLDETCVQPDSYLVEGISCPDDDCGEFEALVAAGTFAFAVGHDHRNSFAGRLSFTNDDAGHNASYEASMLLAASPTCGFGSYGPAAQQRGARLFEFDIRHPFEPRTQIIEFGEIIGNPSSSKPYTYGLMADSEHDLPEIDLLRKPSLITRLLRRIRHSR